MEAPSPRSGPAASLVAAVAELRTTNDPEEWTLARWHDERGRPGIASFRRRLRWLDHPTLDRHQVVSARYAAGPDGLPADDAAFDSLTSLEDELEGLVGVRGILVGHESHRGTRRFHLYTDGEDQNVDEIIGTWARSRGVSVEATADPAWTEVRHFTG